MSLAAKDSGAKKAAAELARPRPADLLAWYDRHRRVLPWRARAGERADPYRVWLSEIMLQQTTVKAVAPYYARFLDALPHRRGPCARRRSRTCSSSGPGSATTRARATCMPARGPWSSGMAEISRQRRGAAHAARHRRLYGGRDCGDRVRPRASPVDGNVERVIARLFAVEDELPAAKPRIRALAERLTPQRRAGDFAQAMMDLGATICTPKNPACALCPWIHVMRGAGARRSGEFSAQGGRRRPASCGAARRLWRCVRTVTPDAHAAGRRPARRHDRSPDHRMDFVTSTTTTALRAAPTEGVVAPPRLASVTHTFTHFPLELIVYAAQVPARTRTPRHALGRAVRLRRRPCQV